MGLKPALMRLLVIVLIITLAVGGWLLIAPYLPSAQAAPVLSGSCEYFNTPAVGLFI